MNKFEQVRQYIQWKGKVDSKDLSIWAVNPYKMNGDSAIRYARELKERGKVRHPFKDGVEDKHSFEWIRQDKSGQMSML